MTNILKLVVGFNPFKTGFFEGVIFTWVCQIDFNPFPFTFQEELI